MSAFACVVACSSSTTGGTGDGQSGGETSGTHGSSGKGESSSDKSHTSGGSSTSSDSGGGGGYCVAVPTAAILMAGLGGTTCTGPGATSCPGGKLVASCPTANLYGCCKATAADSEECYYDDSSANLMKAEKAMCGEGGGATWSTTP
jgi:hypothetical protein